MCDRDHPQPSNLYPLIFYKDGKTCVFWDVEDYPIPDGLDPASIYQRIKEAVNKYGCDAELSIQAYADDNNNTFSDDLRRQFSDAGFILQVFTEDGKTCVFWDVEDYPIPDCLDPASIYQRIKDAVNKYGCDAEVSIQAYADDNNTFSDRQYSDAGFKLEVFTEGDKYARHCSMYGDIMLWSLENPKSNVIIIAKITEYDFADRIGCLTRVWSYGLLLSQAKPEWLQELFPVGSVPSFLTAIFDGRYINRSSRSKGKRGRYSG